MERREGEPVVGQGASQEGAGEMQMPIVPTLSQTTEVGPGQCQARLWAQAMKSRNLKAFLVTTAHCLDRL